MEHNTIGVKSVPTYLFSETYCGGYSGEDPPLPIPNREVKLTIADGTAPPGGRVGSCHALTKSFETKVSELFLCYTMPRLSGAGARRAQKEIGSWF